VVSRVGIEPTTRRLRGSRESQPIVAGPGKSGPAFSRGSRLCRAGVASLGIRCTALHGGADRRSEGSPVGDHETAPHVTERGHRCRLHRIDTPLACLMLPTGRERRTSAPPRRDVEWVRRRRCSSTLLFARDTSSLASSLTLRPEHRSRECAWSLEFCSTCGRRSRFPRAHTLV